MTKRIVSAALSMTISSSVLQTVPFDTKAETTDYPYTMFALSNEEGAISFNVSNYGINGKIATNGTIVANVSFDKTRFADEQVCAEMIYIPNRIESDFFSSVSVDVIEGDYEVNDVNININSPVSVGGTMELNGNISLQSGIRSVEDIVIRGDVQNSGNTVIYSKYGDIDIECTNVNLNGLIYAPFGNVHIKADSLNMNNAMIIADTFTIDTPNLNANYSQYFGKYFGEVSDTMNIPEEDFQYLADDNNNGVPDFFERSINWKYSIDTDNDGVPDIIENLEGTDPYIAEDDYHEVLDNYSLELMYKNPLIMYSPPKQKYFIYGDLNDDLVLDVFDFIIMKRMVMNGEFNEQGDLDADGDMDVDDAIWLMDFLLARAKSFPVYNKFDTDNDGLSDFVEVEYSNTSIHNEDTDGDGLTDYFEYAVLNSDPNTAETGIGNADPDKDDLTNLQEQQYGTDPFNADTDGDGFSDREEVNKYGTDPLKEDTDGDGLTDWEEIVDMAEFNLNPTNASTNGTPDGQRIFTQIISADDELLSDINTEDNAYSLSIEINASGNARRCLNVVESGYTDYMKNGAAIGAVPEITYDDSYTLQDITLKFEIKEDFRDSVIELFTDNYDTTYNEDLAGIKRLNVFKFFEEIDEEMPIDTEYDVANNTVYVKLTSDTFEETDVVEGINVGSYSLVDLEVWGSLMNGYTSEDEAQKTKSPPMLEPTSVMYPSNVSILANNTETGEIDVDSAAIKKMNRVFAAYINAKSSEKDTNISYAVYYGNHFYAVIMDDISWTDAKKKCEKLGGHLMTPSSAGEFALLTGGLTHGNTTNHYWIGAQRVGNQWEFVNNEGAVTYIDRVKKVVNGRSYFLKHFGTLLNHSELFYADGMSYYPQNSNAKKGYIIEWDSPAAYARGVKGFNSSGTTKLVKSLRGTFVLKSNLTKGSNVDTDGDGISDYDELNHKLLNKVTGSTTATTVSISDILRTLTTNTTSKSLYNNGTIASKLAEAIAKTASTTSTVVATPLIDEKLPFFSGDPNQVDEDGDYIIYEENNKRFDPTIIDANVVDDSDIFVNRDNNRFYSIKEFSESSYPTTVAGEILVNPYQHGGGIASVKKMPENVQKIQITYNRNSSYNKDGKIEFTINPKQANDYEFVITFDTVTQAQTALEDDNFITISAKKDNNRKAVKYIQDDKKLVCQFYTYGNKKYKININNSMSNCNMECIFYQYNWVYAPNGGIRSGENYGSDKTSGLDETFICQDAMIRLCEDILKKHNQAEWVNVNTQVKNSNKNDLRYWVNNHKVLIDELNKNMLFNRAEISSAMGKYWDVSLLTQWVLEYVPKDGAGTLLGTISKASNVVPVLDKTVFVGQKLYEARMNQLPNAMIEGNFNICIYNTKQYYTAPEGEYDFLWVPAVIPCSCGTWQGRDGVNGKYIARYVDSGHTKHMRCNVYAFDY